MTKFRKGDRVSIMATVKYDTDKDDKTGVLIRADGYYGDMLVMPVHMTVVQPRIDVGDSVWHRGDEEQGTVLASSDGRMWVRLNSGAFKTWHSADLDFVAEAA